jgi:putative hydrolase of the HAD superfamily
MMKALKRVKIDHFFTYSYTSKELGANKPDPRFFQQLLSNMGVKAEECIMIGNDYEKDIIGANQAGIQAIWYNQDQIHKPPFLGSIIQSMNELSKAVEKLAGLSQS